jgi:hypothetical protein
LGRTLLAGIYGGLLQELFASNNLIDVQPPCLVPTWRNGRSGTDAIARRLDRFLVVEAFLTSSSSPSSWVEFPFVSDHAPILLKLLPPTLHRSTPFKFNHHWLHYGDYSTLVREVWSDHRFLDEENPQRCLAWKLNVLKSKSKKWFLELKLTQSARLTQLESAIQNYIYSSSTTALTEVETVDLAALESNRADILREQENAWRLRSRATWLKSGDSNTKYFHKLATYNRSKKSIWSIDNTDIGVHQRARSD